MRESVKKNFLCVLISALFVFCMIGAALTVIANGESEEMTVNYILNGGFRLFGGNSVSDDTFDTNDFSISTTDQEMILDSAFKLKYLGKNGEANTNGVLIFKLADEDMRGKSFNKVLLEAVDGDVTVNSDGTWAMPRSIGTAYPSDVLNGFVLDTNKNGIIDENETLYAWGDSIPVSDGMQLICSYESDYLFGTNDNEFFERCDLMGLKYIDQERGNTVIGDSQIWSQKYCEAMITRLGVLDFNSYYTYNGTLADSLSLSLLNNGFLSGSNNYTKYLYSENKQLSRNNLDGLKNVEQLIFPYVNQIFSGYRQGDLCQSELMLPKLSTDSGEVVITLGNDIYELGENAFNFSVNSASNISKARIILPGFSDKAGGAKRVLSYFGDPSQGSGTSAGSLKFGDDDTVSMGFSQTYLFGLKEEYDTQNDMNLILYVKKGTTSSIYPTKDSEWYSEDYTMKTAGGHNVPVRECVAINFDLNGGIIGGKAFFPATYIDAGAVSVTDSAGKEYNLCEYKNDARGLSYNPSAVNLNYLSAYKPSDPVRSGYMFVGWKDSTGYIWTDEDWESGGFSPDGEDGDFTLTAEWLPVNEGSLNIHLGEGFRIDGNDNISTEDFSVNVKIGATYTLDQATAASLFVVDGEQQYIYGKAAEEYRGKTPNLPYHAVQIQGVSVEVNADGTYIPAVDKVIPGGVLFGLFNDSNGNKVLDSGEDLYRTGDSFVVTEGMNLTCYFDDNKFFKPVDAANIHSELEMVDGCIDLPAEATDLTIQDMQPLYARTVSLGTATFIGAMNFREIYLPETITTIKGELNYGPFKDSGATNIYGIENVVVFDNIALVRAFAQQNSQEMQFVLNPQVKGIKRWAFKFENTTTLFKFILTADAAALGYDGVTKTYLVRDGYDITNPFGNNKQYIYVPYGQTHNYYPTIDTYVESQKYQFSQGMMSGNANTPTADTFMTDGSGDFLKVREYHTVSFNLNGGIVNGYRIIKDTYMDARAISVQTKNIAGTVQEVNLREAGQVLRNGVTLNPEFALANGAEQDLSILKAEKPSDPIKFGFTFVGWKDQFGNMWTDEEWAAGGKSGVDYEGQVMLTAVWKVATYNINYELNGGTNAASNPTTFTVQDEFELSAATRDGYKFDGWYTDSQFTNRIEKISRGTTGDITLYAKFIGYATVSIDGVSQSVETSGSYILPDYTKENSKGWIINDKIYEAGAEVELPIGSTLDVKSFTFSASIEDRLTVYIREYDAEKSGIMFRVNFEFSGMTSLPEGISIATYFESADFAVDMSFEFNQTNIMQDENGMYILTRIIDVTDYCTGNLSFGIKIGLTYEGEESETIIVSTVKNDISIAAVAQAVKALPEYESLSEGYKSIIEGWCKE